MPVPEADSYLQQVGLTAAAAAVTAIVGSLIIGGFLAGIARRSQFRREDRQIRDKLIDDVTHTAGVFFIKLEVYRRFVIEIDPIDGVHRFSDEVRRRRDELDAAYEAGAVEATAMESRLKAYFPDPSVAAAWHGAWDCLTTRYYSMIVVDRGKLEDLYRRSADPEHAGLSVEQLADRVTVFKRYWELRDQAIEMVATLQMRHGA